MRNSSCLLFLIALVLPAISEAGSKVMECKGGPTLEANGSAYDLKAGKFALLSGSQLSPEPNDSGTLCHLILTDTKSHTTSLTFQTAQAASAKGVLVTMHGSGGGSFFCTFDKNYKSLATSCSFVGSTSSSSAAPEARESLRQTESLSNGDQFMTCDYAGTGSAKVHLTFETNTTTTTGWVRVSSDSLRGEVDQGPRQLKITSHGCEVEMEEMHPKNGDKFHIKFNPMDFGDNTQGNIKLSSAATGKQKWNKDLLGENWLCTEDIAWHDHISDCGFSWNGPNTGSSGADAGASQSKAP